MSIKYHSVGGVKERRKMNKIKDFFQIDFLFTRAKCNRSKKEKLFVKIFITKKKVYISFHSRQRSLHNIFFMFFVASSSGEQ
jgi:hypothetical protein